jgi:predicted ATPase
MYIKTVSLENIRSIEKLEWRLPVWEKEAGWHVIIGDNGSGKSTFLRSIALALVGPQEAIALRQDWKDWLHKSKNEGFIILTLSPHKAFDKFAGKGRAPNTSLVFALAVYRHNGSVFLTRGKGVGKDNPDKHIWSGKSGWFSVAYGPFRRFAGGDKDFEKIFYSYPKLAAHLSIFGENIALTECLDWLKDLQFKKLEKHPEGDILDRIKAFINQEGFLPHHARLEKISSEGVEFVDGNNCKLPVEELSDGYRSVLSMTFELIRQLTRTYKLEDVFDSEDSTKIIAPGVVLIDEVDAHLHPTWQRKIGLWFRTHFPNLQFIVTTHSPLVCQAAEHGTVFQLPKPGSKEQGRMIEGEELNRLLYGNVLDAYGTELFGENVTRSEESKKRMQRLAELNRKELQGKLSAAERKEQKELRTTLPTSAHTTKKD